MSSQPTAEILESRLLFSGDGLLAQYFNRGTPEPKATVVDANVNFNWRRQSPQEGMRRNRFLVHWTGQIEPPASGTYTFTTRADDGTRVWVNGELLINNMRGRKMRERSGTIELEGGSGQRYDIRIEYRERRRKARISLMWSGTAIGDNTTIVPQEVLYSTVQTTPPPVNAPNPPSVPEPPQPAEPPAVDPTVPPPVDTPSTPEPQPVPPTEPPTVEPPTNEQPPVTNEPPVNPEPSVTEPPVTEPPIAEPPVVEPPVANPEPPVNPEPPPVVEPPVAEPPVAEPPPTPPPVTEPPVIAPPTTPNPGLTPSRPRQVIGRPHLNPRDAAIVWND